MSTVLYNTDALAARARNLGPLNGIDFGIVTLDSASPPAFAVLEVHFYNDQTLDALVTAASTPAEMWALLSVSGGERVIGGSLSGQVHVTALTHSGPGVIQFNIAPVGDYSRYTLTILEPGFDPIFATLQFRFRPGCFSANCKPLPIFSPAVTEPAIDYLAKDYDSFRHTLIAAMMQRVPNWQATTEASLDVVLLDLFSAAADELSNYQDRVMQEAYWPTAQKRISLRRHARLMDYFPYEGNQSSTVLALNFPGTTGYTLNAGTAACTGAFPPQADASAFVVSADASIDPLFSSLQLYTWSDAIPSLAKGATSADLAFSSAANALNAQNLIRDGKIQRLLVQEWLNPATGQAAGADPTKRQVVQLIGAKAASDPLTGDAVLHVTWSDTDALTDTYCFVVDVNGLRVPDISLFHGNLVDVVQGTKQEFQYVSPGTPLSPGMYAYYTNASGAVECRLPPAFPVLWTKTANQGYDANKVPQTFSLGPAVPSALSNRNLFGLPFQRISRYSLFNSFRSRNALTIASPISPRELFFSSRLRFMRERGFRSSIFPTRLLTKRMVFLVETAMAPMGRESRTFFKVEAYSRAAWSPSRTFSAKRLAFFAKSTISFSR